MEPPPLQSTCLNSFLRKVGSTVIMKATQQQGSTLSPIGIVYQCVLRYLHFQNQAKVGVNWVEVIHIQEIIVIHYY